MELNTTEYNDVKLPYDATAHKVFMLSLLENSEVVSTLDESISVDYAIKELESGYDKVDVDVQLVTKICIPNKDPGKPPSYIESDMVYFDQMRYMIKNMASGKSTNPAVFSVPIGMGEAEELTVVSEETELEVDHSNDYLSLYTKSMAIPLPLCKWAIENSYIKPLRLYLYLKHVTLNTGITHINGRDKELIAQNMGVTARSVSYWLTDLRKRDWVGYDKVTGKYYIRSYYKVFRKEGITGLKAVRLPIQTVLAVQKPENLINKYYNLKEYKEVKAINSIDPTISISPDIALLTEEGKDNNIVDNVISVDRLPIVMDSEIFTAFIYSAMLGYFAIRAKQREKAINKLKKGTRINGRGKHPLENINSAQVHRSGNGLQTSHYRQACSASASFLDVSMSTISKYRKLGNKYKFISVIPNLIRLPLTASNDINATDEHLVGFFKSQNPEVANLVVVRKGKVFLEGPSFVAPRLDYTRRKRGAYSCMKRGENVNSAYNILNGREMNGQALNVEPTVAKPSKLDTFYADRFVIYKDGDIEMKKESIFLDRKNRKNANAVSDSDPNANSIDAGGENKPSNRPLLTFGTQGGTFVRARYNRWTAYQKKATNIIRKEQKKREKEKAADKANQELGSVSMGQKVENF